MGGRSSEITHDFYKQLTVLVFGLILGLILKVCLQLVSSDSDITSVYALLSRDYIGACIWLCVKGGSF